MDSLGDFGFLKIDDGRERLGGTSRGGNHSRMTDHRAPREDGGGRFFDETSRGGNYSRLAEHREPLNLGRRGWGGMEPPPITALRDEQLRKIPINFGKEWEVKTKEEKEVKGRKK